MACGTFFERGDVFFAGLSSNVRMCGLRDFSGREGVWLAELSSNVWLCFFVGLISKVSVCGLQDIFFRKGACVVCRTFLERGDQFFGGTFVERVGVWFVGLPLNVSLCLCRNIFEHGDMFLRESVWFVGLSSNFLISVSHFSFAGKTFPDV